LSVARAVPNQQFGGGKRVAARDAATPAGEDASVPLRRDSDITSRETSQLPREIGPFFVPRQVSAALESRTAWKIHNAIPNSELAIRSG
jgi:hypothetical protein